MKDLRWKNLVRLGFKIPLNKKVKARKVRSPSSYYGECHLNLQRLKAHYHSIKTSYLRRTYKLLSRKHKSNLQDHLVNVLESRLDSILRRSTLFKSIAQTSQIILHKHVLINGKVLNIRSYQVKVGDEITFSDQVNHLLDKDNLNMIPPYLNFDIDENKIRLIRPVEAMDIQYDVDIEFNMVINALKR